MTAQTLAAEAEGPLFPSKAILRIFKPPSGPDGSGEPVGAGFLVNAEFAITCAHVVAGALGLSVSAQPEEFVRLDVDLPLTGETTSPATTASIHMWGPTQAPGGADVAVLRLDRPLPGAEPTWLAELDTRRVEGHRAKVVGFPIDDGVWHEGRLRGEQAGGRVQLDRDGAGYRVSPGFSGSPVWDKDLGGVIGLIAKADLGEVAASFLIPTSKLIEAWPELRALRQCPFPGLDPFDEGAAAWFFGRESEKDQVANAVSGSRWTTLIGPSGCGKSSLAKAGVTPLRRSAGDCPVTVRFRPADGTDPLLALAGELAKLLHPEEDSAESLSQQLADHGIGPTAARILRPRHDQRLLIVIDQFEELLDHDPSDRAALAELLSEQNAPETVAVLATLRADSLGAVLADPHLGPLVKPDSGQEQGSGPGRNSDEFLRPVGPDQLLEIVTLPVAAVPGLYYEPGLVELITRDAGSEPGNLPAIGLTLAKLWEGMRSDGLLTHRAYQDLGGISGALSTYAAEIWKQFVPAKDKAVADKLLTRLVRTSHGIGVPARRVASRTEMGADEWEIARRLAGSRLLVLNQVRVKAEAGRENDQVAYVETVELAHEALIAGWDKLTDLVKTHGAFLDWRDSVQHDMDDWKRAEHAADLLPTATVLTDAKKWLPARDAELTDEQHAYLEQGRAHHRTRARRRRLAVATLAVFALLATSGLAGSLVFQHRADQAQQHELAQYLAAQADDLRNYQPGLAKQLSLLAYHMDPQAGRGALLNSQSTPGIIDDQQPGYDLASDADGRVLAISTGDGITLRDLHDSATGRINGLRTGPIAVTRGGDLLAAADFDTASDSTAATLRLWNLTDLSHPRQTAEVQVPSGISALAVSTDGGTLFAGSGGGQILRWNIGNPAAPAALPGLSGGSDDVDSLAVSPKRNLLASTSGNTVQLWDTTDAAHTVALAAFDSAGTTDEVMGSPTPMHRVAFDRTGDLLAFQGPNNIPLLWDIRDAHAPTRVPYQEGDEQATQTVACFAENLVELAFSPQANQLAGRCGGNWYIWTYLTASDPHAMHIGAVQDAASDSSDEAIAFDPSDPRRLLNATSLGVEVWDVSSPYQPGAKAFLPSIDGKQDYLFTAFTTGADGKRQLTAAADGDRNALWDTTDLSHPRLLLNTPILNGQSAIALSTDGRLLADAEPCGASGIPCIRLYDTRAPTHALATINNLVDGVGLIAFSPTKPILAVSDTSYFTGVGTEPASIRIYDIADPAQPRQIAQISAGAGQLLFSPDGATLVAEDYGNSNLDQVDQQTFVPQLRSWDMADPARPTRLWARPAPSGQDATSLAFSPDGAILADYGDDGVLQLWHVSQHRLVGDPVTVSVGSGYESPHVAFSPDGTELALLDAPPGETSGSGDVRTEIWDLTDLASPALQYYFPAITDTISSPLLAFSADGRELGVLRPGAGVDFWDTNAQDVATGLCTAVGDPISAQEWEHYLPGHPYQPPCPGDTE